MQIKEQFIKKFLTEMTNTEMTNQNNCSTTVFHCYVIRDEEKLFCSECDDEQFHPYTKDYGFFLHKSEAEAFLNAHEFSHSAFVLQRTNALCDRTNNFFKALFEYFEIPITPTEYYNSIKTKNFGAST